MSQKSKVYIGYFKLSTYHDNLLNRCQRAVAEALASIDFNSRDIFALKTHFGEYGNVSYLRPAFSGKIAEFIKSKGSRAFLCDTNTLYLGERSNSVDHIISAHKNGFAYSTIGIPIIIADGLTGKSEVEIQVKEINSEAEMISKAYIASDIWFADGMIVLSHFKGHEIHGFGGALKNLGMGCASRRGKLDMHADFTPNINPQKCILCQKCFKHCPAEAIKKAEKTAVIDTEKCIGCGECIISCNYGAIRINWSESGDPVIKKTAEYAWAAQSNKSLKTGYVNIIADVSPLCDCCGFNDIPIVPNIGICASLDPVAIDQACLDLVNNSPGCHGSALNSAFEPSTDKFKDLYPQANSELILDHSQKLGLGTRNYELIQI